ncbi:di-heme-cytochrome C peroxidase [Paraglaciecola sp.]|uniref:di-heme-cytochrome C peroxidase n=1 Tax=Paraglaciecola sp. TaxID=1920173 RepID=UPI003EFAF961
MATIFQQIFASLFYLIKNIKLLIIVIVLLAIIALIIGKTYQGWDDDPARGAIPIENGAFGDNYSTPTYLEQGWSANDSLWFYNTTQGSALLPYDIFIALEQADSNSLFRDNKNIDRYRYLPQKPTFFNPDGFPVGFVKETYQGKDYMGYTCAACHTGQVNYNGQAIRIDGGPAMADMVGFLSGLEKSMLATLNNQDKNARFVDSVLALNNDFSTKEEVIESLQQWTRTIRLYNTVNHSHIDYGYARLDAFGRIYNRVLQHMINKPQLATAMKLTVSPTGKRILTNQQIENVLEGIGENIIVDKQFGLVFERLASKESGYPGLNQRNLLRVRNQVFNEANAPTSYPFLWDIAQSDYVQWNGVANNSGVGPLGRNTGEVIGVFGILDWTSHQTDGFSLSAKLTGQDKLKQQVDFTSSIDLTNLRRLESHLKSLKSPVWPQEILGKIDKQKAERGQVIYAKYCQSCHEVIDRNNWDRLVVAKMSDIDFIGTDKAAAVNGVAYSGKSGNLKHTVQATDVGDLVIEENAPVIQILTSATKGVIATPDADKMFIRRWLDRIYDIGASFFDNTIPNTIKSGNYKSDTTSSPYNSLLAYKARSLNGIWATAPYLHNGSVPSLYDLLLPQEERPSEFMVGSREFDPVKIGFRTEGYDGFRYRTLRVGDKNTGHEYGAGRTPQLNGEVLPALNESERWDLIEYIKTL